jgi:hypothetical protein
VKPLRKTLDIVLIVLTFFLSLTAILGGIALLAHINTPPVEMLQGSTFRDYTIPALALMLIVGGSALFAAILLLRKSKFALLFAATAGVIIMFFEFVEALIIGSPAGAARTLQIFYFGLGTLVVIAAMSAWFLDLLPGYAGRDRGHERLVPGFARRAESVSSGHLQRKYQHEVLIGPARQATRFRKRPRTSGRLY